MRIYLRRNHSLVTLLTLISLFSIVGVNAETQQEHVHNMSHNVMPFDLAKTIHLFKMTESGGIQKVIVTDMGDPEQIALIQHHLQMEAEQFQHGDYSDPATLHGVSMPGLKELQKGAAHIKVIYTPLSNCAEITFETTDIHLLTALHRWFGAQLSEHGADAKAE
jgi:hypothetical protein